MLFNDFSVSLVPWSEVRHQYGKQKLPCLVYYTAYQVCTVYYTSYQVCTSHCIRCVQCTTHRIRCVLHSVTGVCSVLHFVSGVQYACVLWCLPWVCCAWV